MSGKPKILVVEDHSPTALLLAAILTRAGCDVKVASSGQEAMQLAQEESFQLVTLDVDLPDISGFDIFLRLRQNSDSSAAPILFISGRSDEVSRRRGIELGAADYIEKPLAGADCVQRILSHIKPTPAHV